jgi:hypothetical protein
VLDLINSVQFLFNSLLIRLHGQSTMQAEIIALQLGREGQ